MQGKEKESRCPELLSSIWEFVFFQLQNGLYQFESQQNFGGENPFASRKQEN